MKHNDIKEGLLYVYPIMGMYEMLQELLVKQHVKFHEFYHTANVATPETTWVPAPNNDTTYSRCWLDLRNGPVIIETPDTKGRFYTIQLLDMFSETVDNLGKRKYGTEAHRFAIMHVDCKDQVEQDMIVIRCNTYIVLAFLRVLIGDESQLTEVKCVQQGFVVYPYIQQRQSDPLPPYRVSSRKAYVETAMHLLQVISSPSFDLKEKQQIAQLLEVNETELEACYQEMLTSVDEGGRGFGEDVHGWRIARNKIGVYGQDYYQRGIVWFKGALANVPEESLYPSTFLDADHEQLDGSKHTYCLHFTKAELPPVSQFWSLTMYLYRNGFLTENQINRYSIGDRSEQLQYEKDGSLTIYIQAEKPNEHMDNWLPCPTEPFYMTLRLYGPSKDAIDGSWNPPAVQKVR